MKKITSVASLITFYAFIFPSSILAAGWNKEETPRIGIRQPDNSGVDTSKGSPDSLLETVLRNGVLFVFTFASMAVVIYFLWGAVDYILSGGDKEKMGSARKKMTSALIGLVVLSLSFALIGLVGSIVGINPLEQSIPFLGDPNKPK